MEPNDYIRILRKRWWIIAVAVVLTAGSAVAFSELKYPEYTATAEVVILPARPDWGLAQSAKMLLRTYMTVINSHEKAQEVINQLNLPMRAEQLLSKARFAAEDDRMVVKIEVESYDGEQAKRIAEVWADQLIHWRNQQNQTQRKEDRVEARRYNPPTLVQSWPPGTKVMLASGTVFGFVIAGVIIFFLEWLEAGIVRTPQDVERQLNLTVVGAIPSPD